MAPEDGGERPGLLARRVQQLPVSLFAELCAPVGITPARVTLLSALAEIGEVDQTALPRQVALDHITTSALKRLEACGLVRRRGSPADHRARSCVLTPKGRQMPVQMEGAARRAHAATVAVLTPEERRQFFRPCRRSGRPTLPARPEPL